MDDSSKNFNFKYIILKQWIVDNIKNKTFQQADGEECNGAIERGGCS